MDIEEKMILNILNRIDRVVAKVPKPDAVATITAMIELVNHVSDDYKYILDWTAESGYFLIAKEKIFDDNDGTNYRYRLSIGQVIKKTLLD